VVSQVYTKAVLEKRSQSPADVVLAQQASNLAQLRVTPGQIRRWRKARLLPMKKKGRGRGRGWRYEYPTGSAEFAASVALELRTCKTLDRAALASFAHGVSPTSKDVLARLLAAPFTDVQTALGNDPHRTARELATKAEGRASTYPMIRQLKSGLDWPSELGTLLEGTFGFLFSGETVGFRHALEILGVSEAASDELVGNVERDYLSPKDQSRRLRVIADAMERASLADYEQARDDALVVHRALARVTGALTTLLGLRSEPHLDDTDAVGLVPVFLTLRGLWGNEQTDEFMGLFKDPMPLFAKVAAAFEAWSAQNPDDAAILGPLGLSFLKGTLEPEQMQ